jgi:glycosyltransferase involved in cell wall biosynthesis
MLVNEVLVSVIIPTYKRAELLPRAIGSVLDQTYKNIEVIIVDDNNPDTEFRKQTEQYMLKYSGDPRINYIKHHKNMNGAAARNTGLKHANGEFICFLDDDDWFMPGKIEKQLIYLFNNPSFHGAYCGRSQNNRVITSHCTGDLSKNILLSEFIPGPPTLMLSKYSLESIGGFNESYRRHQDSELLLRFFEKYTIGSVPEPLVVIGENLAENELHGLELERLKEDLLFDFGSVIDKLDSTNKYFKKTVYSRHYSQVFFDHLQNSYYSLALKVFVRNIKIAPIQFMKCLFSRLFSWLRFKINFIGHN